MELWVGGPDRGERARGCRGSATLPRLFRLPLQAQGPEERLKDNPSRDFPQAISSFLYYSLDNVGGLTVQSVLAVKD